MFEPKSLKTAAIIAMVLSAIGLISNMFLITSASLAFILGVISWGFLLWGANIGYKLSDYKLKEEEYKKTGICIYGIIAASVLYYFAGFTLGLIISVVILGNLWMLKNNFDDRNHSSTVKDSSGKETITHNPDEWKQSGS